MKKKVIASHKAGQGIIIHDEFAFNNFIENIKNTIVIKESANIFQFKTKFKIHRNEKERTKEN